MATLRSANKHLANRTVILPLIGKASFDDDCETIVEDGETAKKLTEMGIGLELVDDFADASEENVKNKSEDSKPLGKEDDKESIKESDGKGEIESSSKGSGEDWSKVINQIDKIADLKEVASDADFPESEWKSIRSKAKMRKYLLEKFK